ncbi:MAG: branched-chain amino acid ABC transporter permease [Pseudomonadota bacterium]|jgi:branched-chain amino acid transport system permease protein|nr:branched-chain amino acid ABC transporter permease [Gammaproteobacteria bacterium]MEC8870186.1 branched-chain amino acid ABC transporter permease [Pseudomonadota bacterium]HIA78412.1 branched-chain amino acid ABC transporter permease [Gammaproteobacteria bacterium]HIO16910.1 branched-chain amino acid ABC transporter permease [Gammaproteobacteria bacterium]|tara:strand:- start:1708 stop:2619 length:912 start_codon:yes stop_codon:yes gene_type:complete
MDYYLNLINTIGIHTLLGLSAYLLILTGQVSMAQAGFFGIGAYTAAILTVIFESSILTAIGAAMLVSGGVAFLVGFPALRVRGLMLVVATVAFSEFARMFFYNLKWRVVRDGAEIGPDGTMGFAEIRYFNDNGWLNWEVTIFLWVFVAVVMALIWWSDKTRIGAVLRAVGEDELAADSTGINVTVVKVAAMTAGGVVAGLAGSLYAHQVTDLDHHTFTVLLATFAIAYPILGGLSNVFGTLIAVLFIQGLLVEGLRFLGDWRMLLFGALIILAMNIKPLGLFDNQTIRILRNALGVKRQSGSV